MNAKQQFEEWKNSPLLEDWARQELAGIETDPEEIEARFGQSLTFGTAGLRGILGVGTGRMNPYTVRHATQGMADVILKQGEKAQKRGVVIAHDPRHFSRKFAEAAAEVLAGNDIPVYLFEDVRPTPELSFAIGRLNTIAGINITASHNPKEYNGYKAYWEDGAQLSLEKAAEVFDAMQARDVFDVKSMELTQGVQEGLITLIGDEIDRQYLEEVLAQQVHPGVCKKTPDFKVVYTPFHGAGHILVPEALKQIGVKQVICVPEQMVLDGDFPTVKSPNPEDKEGFYLAEGLAEKENADIIVGTDPDSDRVGLLVRDEAGKFLPLTGNQVGVLLLNYIIKGLKEEKKLPENPALIKTIVTSDMADQVAKKNGVAVYNTLTGFRFIGEKAAEVEKNEGKKVIFAFEESYGYLKGDYCRDKDGVVTSMLICEMACYYKSRGKTLYGALMDCFEEYGYYADKTVSVKIPGNDAQEKMQAAMSRARGERRTEIAGMKVARFIDYQKGVDGLPPANVLFYGLENGSTFIIRPSGTEPKIKFYLLARAESQAGAAEKIEQLAAFAKQMAGQ